MTLWDSTLHSESKVVRLKSHWCARLDFETQPHYEAPGRLRLVLEIVWWLTSSEWGCLFVNDPKLALMQPNFWQKKFEQLFHFISVFLLLFLVSKQISVLVLAVFQSRYLRVITIQPIRQLQSTGTKVTSENLIISFLKNNMLQ